MRYSEFLFISELTRTNLHLQIVLVIDEQDNAALVPVPLDL